MTDLLQLAAVLVVLYALYAATLKKWNYTTEDQRIKRRVVLKQRGMSSTFYFIHNKTLLFLNLFSGGVFTLFWLFKQWKAICFGFRRLDNTPLKFGPFLRTLFGFISFFQLVALVNRTCEYTRRPIALPPFIWGTVWLCSLIGIFWTNGWNKLIPYLLWCYVPCAVQDKINGLTSKALSPKPKMSEATAAVFGLACVAAGYVAWNVFGKN